MTTEQAYYDMQVCAAYDAMWKAEAMAERVMANHVVFGDDVTMTAHRRPNRVVAWVYDDTPPESSVALLLSAGCLVAVFMAAAVVFSRYDLPGVGLLFSVLGVVSGAVMLRGER